MILALNTRVLNWEQINIKHRSNYRAMYDLNTVRRWRACRDRIRAWAAKMRQMR